MTGPSLEELLEERLEGASTLEGLINDSLPGPNAGFDLGVGEHGAAMAGGEDQFLLELLWPAFVSSLSLRSRQRSKHLTSPKPFDRWPSHLPSPGKLERIVEAFFSSVGFANLVLNKPRFLARLALPPKHKNFP